LINFGVLAQRGSGGLLLGEGTLPARRRAA